ncbi:LPXTG cell wall anchor domain-containing protein [Streptomyces sp. ISL-1]|uniref:LPXTG cell wall anchor domain-containing protein n=1 Tax=Streptomyces sp. ISL-1 TaxID=2817657 RepID=UPI001BE9FBCF|nr:LPXTG cell wall anchor domain-containing protein [Streptomyces sp. ISL-1]MBT2392550.1 LPXTG cell wall anchor domain-containing protein [Streptomyces sp. ISL-1]
MPRRSRRRVAMAVATASLIAAVPLVVAEPAFAQYPPAPTIQIDDVSVPPGDDINHTATGFQSGEGVLARLFPVGAVGAAGAAAAPLTQSRAVAGPKPTATATATASPSHCPSPAPTNGGPRPIVELDTFVADTNGNVAGRVIIPQGTRPGAYDFQLVGQTSGLILSARVTVPLDGDCDDDHGRPGDGDGDDDHGRPGDGDGDGDDDHGRPGDGDGDGDGDHGRPGDGDGDDDHGRPGHGNGNGNGNGSSGHGNGSSGLADTGSSDATVALLAAAGGLVLLGGGSLVITRRRRTRTERG